MSQKFTTFSLIPVTANRTEEVRRLRKDLLLNGKYDVRIRPQTAANQSTEVYLDFKPVSVPTLTPKRHHLFMNAFLCLSWKDHRLTWDPEQYGGVGSFFANSTEVWTAAVIHMEPLNVRGPRDAMVSLSHTGDVAWCPLYSIGAMCKTDMSDFPFDRHKCDIVFSSIIFTQKDVDLHTAGQPVLPEQELSEFRLVSIEARRVVKSYLEGTFVYPMIYYTVLLERRSSVHLFTVLLPTVAVVLVSLLVFWLPPESDRKWTLTGVAMLTSLLLLYRAEDILAGSTNVPKIVKVLGCAVFMNVLIAASTVLSANMAKSPPSWTLPAALVRLSESLVLRLPCPCPVGQPGNGGDGGVQNKSFSNAMAREWATAARALDRILGLVFVATFVVLLCV